MAEPGLFLLQDAAAASPPLITEVMHPAAIEHLILLVDAESIPAWFSGRIGRGQFIIFARNVISLKGPGGSLMLAFPESIRGQHSRGSGPAEDLLQQSSAAPALLALSRPLPPRSLLGLGP